MAAPRVWLRWMRMPVEREDQPRPEPMTAVRKDGTVVDIRRSLGLPSVRGLDDDQGVRWYPYPGEHWS